MNRLTTPAAPRPRQGLTLVELIVAMSILSIGLLGIVGVSAGIARSLGEARSDNLAAVAAQSRFELIAGTACNNMAIVGTSGTVTNRNITETFVVANGGNNTISVIDTVTWVTRRGTRRAAFSTLLPCRPGA
jgi:prepilin-type N-terminal cleavage/methylation domain-containing protein